MPSETEMTGMIDELEMTAITADIGGNVGTRDTLETAAAMLRDVLGSIQ